MKNKVFLIISLILVLVIGLFILTGCGNKKEENKSTDNTQTTSKNESATNTVVNNTNNTATNNKKYEYTYKDGVLTQIVDEEGNPKQTDFVIDGLILVGNRHSYLDLQAESEGIIGKLAQQGYKKDGINASFYLNEYIEFYIDTKYTGSVSDVKILVTPHKTVEELEKMSLSKLEELAENNGGFVLNYKTPEADNYKYIGEGYVNMDYPEGKYDILFTYKGKLAYFINITETKEPTE